MINRFVFYLRNLFKKPFKVAIISYYYPDNLLSVNNGVAVHAYYLSQELAKIGCEVHVFAKGDKNTIKKQYIDNGRIVIHRIKTELDVSIEDFVTKKRMMYFIFDNKVISEVAKEHSRSEINVLHTHGWLTSGAFISKYLNKIKWVHTFHAIEKNRVKFMSKEEKEYFSISQWIESTIKYADCLIAVSKNIREEVIKDFKVKSKKVVYIPNGVDLSLYNSENHDYSQKKILYVGRFSLEKGIDLIPKIAEQVLMENNEARFIAVAKLQSITSLDKTKVEFERLSEEYPERFIWINDSLNREALAKLYKECIIYVQPSRYESFGLCVLEAMACGNAVVVSNRGGLPEVVENAGLISQFNSSRVAEDILKLLGDYRLRERYSRRAIERAKLFAWENVALQVYNVYKTLAHK